MPLLPMETSSGPFSTRRLAGVSRRRVRVAIGGIALLAVVAAIVPTAGPLLLGSDLPASQAALTAGPPLTLDRGAHISILGNTLGERMQHDGWLETYLHVRFPEHDLAIRNLAFSADELTIRLRSEGFGSPDEHLAKQLTDVIFAFFGYSESFQGDAGVAKFQQDLRDFIANSRAQNYNGKSPPQVVIFSPIAHEDLSDPDLPNGAENNARLAKYTAAMRAVCEEVNATFVDLFSASQTLYANNDAPLTMNGIHLNEFGNKLIAQAMSQALFGAAAEVAPDKLEHIRQAVKDKNFYWYHRYRTTDGYSTYGGRSYLKFVNDQTNREVLMRELEVLDTMTANREQRVWARVKGRDITVDDANAPPFIPVITNKPGAGPNGQHLFLSGEEEIQHMTVSKGLNVNLYASEEKFPEMINPVQMAWDTANRLWVAAWPSYPHWKPNEEMNDKLLILVDKDGDGAADECKTFADKLHNPTGFEFWGGGVLVAMAPDLLFLKDTDGDDVADVRVRVLHGLDSADTHHTANSFVLDPGGGLYFQEGVFHRTQAETPYGPVRNYDACVWRFEPRTWKFERYVPYNFANPHGHAFDRWGQDIVHDGTGAQPYHSVLFSGYLDFPDKHNAPPQVYAQRTRPCPATEYLSSPHFPDDMQGNLLVGNVIGFQGILRYRINDKDSSFEGVEQEPLLSSDDPNFRPADMEVGPDGAIYFTDWHNPIIGHMQHNLRDPSRDRVHGRVYRITYAGRPLQKPPKIAGEPVANLLRLLQANEDRTRYRARIELSGRDTAEVMVAMDRWLATLKDSDPNHEHDLLEALWLCQNHNVPKPDLLKRVMSSPDFRARAAATRVLCYWRNEIPDALNLLRGQAQDKAPRVRLEAMRAASFFRVPEAVEVVLLIGEQPMDSYLEYLRGETMRSLDPIWRQALADGREINVTTPVAQKFLMRQLPLDRLMALDRSPAVCQELLLRPGIQDEIRQEAIARLSQEQKQTPVALLLGTLKGLDADNTVEHSVLLDIARLLASRSGNELAAARSDLEQLTQSAKRPVVRQTGLIALIEMDGSADQVWLLANKKISVMQDLLSAVPFVSDASIRAGLYERIEPLLYGLPAELASQASGGAAGRYVRIELPRPGTLTLAEVEVMSGGQNVAKQGRASQKNTSNGGEAGRAIDGNTNGAYGSGTQTHTEENTPDPWWEVDLGEELPLEQINVFNRQEGDLGNRLDGFTLIVLDQSRNEIFRKEGNPAPAENAAFELAGASDSLIRRASMQTLVSMRGQEQKTFHTLAKFITEDRDRLAAIRALQRIPSALWPTDEAPGLAQVLVAQLKTIPETERTSPAALDTLQFTESLAQLLPADAGQALRKELRALGTRVLRVGTLPERMAYDQEVLVVEAGKQVEIIFDNADLMPHNFVITQPGALEEVGLLAESTAQQPDAITRQYVPASDKILLASRLLQNRQSQTLSFKAPQAPGVYPYVCTYPGHWRRMYGALYVVESLDDYLADSKAYLAAHTLEIADDLLKDRRPRTEWSYDDLAASLSLLESGRNYGNGKQIFQVASCVACHRLDNVGNTFGPDLTKLEAKWTTTDILKEVLNPSDRINEKYITYTFETNAGRAFTALVLEETGDAFKVIENPLISADPVVLQKSDLAQAEKAKVSIMPKGLLDKLTREEILDLIAYVTARGDSKHPLFQGSAHDHAHGAGAGSGGADHGGHGHKHD